MKLSATVSAAQVEELVLSTAEAVVILHQRVVDGMFCSLQARPHLMKMKGAEGDCDVVPVAVAFPMDPGSRLHPYMVERWHLEAEMRNLKGSFFSPSLQLENFLAYLVFPVTCLDVLVLILVYLACSRSQTGQSNLAPLTSSFAAAVLIPRMCTEGRHMDALLRHCLYHDQIWMKIVCLWQLLATISRRRICATDLPWHLVELGRHPPVSRQGSILRFLDVADPSS